MSAYLYPELKSKKAYKDAIAQGLRITAKENSIFGSTSVENGTVTF